MIRLVFASCLLLHLSSCSGIAGLAMSAASTAKSAYDGYDYLKKNLKDGTTDKEPWNQRHDEGIWYGGYIFIKGPPGTGRFHRIYTNPSDEHNKKKGATKND